MTIILDSRIFQSVIWQISGITVDGLTARNIDAAESRPNRFCIRRTIGYPNRIKK